MPFWHAENWLIVQSFGSGQFAQTDLGQYFMRTYDAPFHREWCIYILGRRRNTGYLEKRNTGYLDEKESPGTWTKKKHRVLGKKKHRVLGRKRIAGYLDERNTGYLDEKESPGTWKKETPGTWTKKNRRVTYKGSFKGYNVILQYYIHFCIKFHLYGTSWWSFNRFWIWPIFTILGHAIK